MLKTIALALISAAFLLGCQGNKETPLHGTSTRRASAREVVPTKAMNPLLTRTQIARVPD